MTLAISPSSSTFTRTKGLVVSRTSNSLVARNGRSDTVDPARGIAVAPFDGPGSTVIETDVAHELSGQVFDGRENASGNDVPLDLGEPDLDLVQPGRVSGSEVQ